MKQLPPVGGAADDVLARLRAMKVRDLDPADGRAFAYVYEAGAEVDAVRKAASALFLADNGLDPTAFPSLLRLENDLVAIALRHLGAPPEAVGSFTSGGTESILLAVKAARDAARSAGRIARRGAGSVVAPVTAHAAFHKAAAYLDLELRTVAVDPATFRARPEALAEAIDADTVLLVASAPQYAHGVCDPVEAIGRLALDAGRRRGWPLPLHVDACVGGWLLPYWKRLGADVPPFDLSVPGVTSLSVDLHKYAFCAKGASLVLYADPSLREHQLFACAGWPGYTVVNATAQSSKSGGPLAAAWAVLHLLGDAGYLDLARRLRDATARLAEGVRAIGDLRLLALPDLCMFAFASDAVGAFHVVDEMAARGWTIQPQLAFGPSPANVHVSVHPGNLGQEDAFLTDLRVAYEAARTLPRGVLARAVAPLVAGGLPGGPDGGAAFADLLGAVGVSATSLPERMAPINELLDALPRPVTEALVKRFVGALFTPGDDDV